MANRLLNNTELNQLVEATVIGCRAHAYYRITADDVAVLIQRGDRETTVTFDLRELTRTAEDVGALLIERLPEEWRPVAEPFDIDATG